MTARALASARRGPQLSRMSHSHELSLADLETAPLAPDAPDYARRLADALHRATPALLAMDDDTTMRHPAPGKWSPREIIGHLIDSASNNHQRFVRAQLTSLRDHGERSGR